MTVDTLPGTPGALTFPPNAPTASKKHPPLHCEAPAYLLWAPRLRPMTHPRHTDIGAGCRVMQRPRVVEVVAIVAGCAVRRLGVVAGPGGHVAAAVHVAGMGGAELAAAGPGGGGHGGLGHQGHAGYSDHLPPHGPGKCRAGRALGRGASVRFSDPNTHSMSEGVRRRGGGGGG